MHSSQIWNTCRPHLVDGVNKAEGVDTEAPGPQIGGQKGPAKLRLSEKSRTKDREEERFMGWLEGVAAELGALPCPRTEPRLLVSH